MDLIQIIGVSFIAIIISIIIKQYRPEFAVYVAIAAGIIILLMCMSKIQGILNFINTISQKTNINIEFIKILIKITGLAILTEFAVSICKDAGETAIASKAEIGGKVIIISMSIPIIQALINTVIKVLP